MKINDGTSYIPKLTANCSYVQFDEDVYTLCIDDEKNPAKFNINGLTKDLLDHIDGARNIAEITLEFNSRNNYNFSTDDILTVLRKQISGYGIFEGDNVEKIKVKDNYLKLRARLLSAVNVRRVTPLFLFLFNKRVFKPLFIFCSLLLTVTFLLELRLKSFYQAIDGPTFLIFLAINIATLVLHEFGHAAACDRFGARSGSIGLGFYLMTPVFYSDVTDVWRLNKEQRVIVDLGGIYFQMIICALLLVAYFLSGSSYWLYLSFFITLSFIINVNPFLRYDGYWALSDVLNISNLRDKSVSAMNQFFGWITGINKNWKSTRLNVFLAVYGIARLIVVVLFIGYMVLYNRNSILYFPVRLVVFLKTIFTDPGSVRFSWLKDNLVGMLLPIVFYVMFIRFVINKFGAKLFNKPSHV